MTGLKISELADRAGVNVSTIRFYERSGLVPDPERTASGYRMYGPHHEARLRFITRARRLGLSLEQITGLLGVWDGSNCATTRRHVAADIDVNLDAMERRIAELQAFVEELRVVRSQLDDGPETCEPALGCCAPAMTMTVPVTLVTSQRTAPSLADSFLADPFLPHPVLAHPVTPGASA